MDFDRTKDTRAAIAQSLATWADWHRALTVAPYGLPASWRGPRQTGESQVRRSRPQGGPVEEFHLVELLHGDLQSGSSLRVGTTQPGFPLQSLSGILRDDQQFMAETVPAVERAAGPGTPLPLTLTVDGAAVQFDALSDGVITVARADLPSFSLLLKARNWDFTSNADLVHLTDLEPFIDGRHASVTAAIHDTDGR